MGDIADAMLDGDLCQGCGVYMEGGNGYPQTCSSCRHETRKAPKPGRAGQQGHGIDALLLMPVPSMVNRYEVTDDVRDLETGELIEWFKQHVVLAADYDAHVRESQRDAEDARRYRWLRDRRGGGDAVVNRDLLDGEELDQMCDLHLADDAGGVTAPRTSF